jgi:hypothetical protein
LESLTFFIIGRNYTILDLARQVKRLLGFCNKFDNEGACGSKQEPGI